MIYFVYKKLMKLQEMELLFVKYLALIPWLVLGSLSLTIMFDYLRSAVGAYLLHLATSNYLYVDGRVLGCSSILYNSIFHTDFFNIGVIIGMIAGSLISKALIPQYLPDYSITNAIAPFGQFTNTIAGLLTGLGTKWGSGCTSGHMLCGISRLSIRSIVASLCFCTTAIITSYLFQTAPSCIGSCSIVKNPDPSEIKLMTAIVIVSVSLTFITRTSARITKFWQFMSSFLSGLLFSTGLIVSGLGNPGTTLGFLALPTIEKFNPSLLMVVLFGIGPNMIEFFTRERKVSTSAAVERLLLPTNTDITLKLVVGSSIFGIGWGLSGICPGPGVLSAVLSPNIGIPWLISFIVGYYIASGGSR